jgi:hypothetical protein
VFTTRAGPYARPVKSSKHPPTLFLQNPFSYTLAYAPRSLKLYPPSNFPTKMYKFLISSMCATYPTHLTYYYYYYIPLINVILFILRYICRCCMKWTHHQKVASICPHASSSETDNLSRTFRLLVTLTHHKTYFT